MRITGIQEFNGPTALLVIVLTGPASRDNAKKRHHTKAYTLSLILWFRSGTGVRYQHISGISVAADATR